MKTMKIFLALLPLILLIGCGDPDVEITSAEYQPKIAVEAFLFCGETVKEIRLSRNFRLGESSNWNDLYLSPAKNSVTATINGTPLEFDETTATYFSNDITVEFDKTYTLEISATIDGKQLHTTSVTTTPKEGFAVLNHDLGTVIYEDAQLIIDFKTSPGTGLYIFSLMAESASVDDFIYDNPYFPNMSSEDLLNNYNTYRYQYNMVSDIDSYSNEIYTFDIHGYDTWFYGKYTTTAYAGDLNFRYYLFTATELQEMDGNFHEPIQIFNGDGIGVFASAIKEIVTFTITK
ncbi:MAG: hypothetical protein V1720_15430 [bacterium]